MRIIRKIDLLKDPALYRKMMRATTVMLVACIAVVLWWVVQGGRRPGFVTLLLVVVLTSFVYPAHEYVHVAFFRLLGPPGTKVVYGFGMGFLFTSAEGAILSRDRYLVVTLAPTVIFTVATLALGRALDQQLIGAAVCVLHLFGCVGDIVMAGEVVATDGVTHVRDTGTGAELLAVE